MVATRHTGEEAKTLNKLAHHPLLMRDGRPRGLVTMHRWCKEPGVRGVVLESWIQGGVRVSSDAAVERFIAALNGAKPGRTTPAQRKRNVESARRRLAKAGI